MKRIQFSVRVNPSDEHLKAGVYRQLKRYALDHELDNEFAALAQIVASAVQVSGQSQTGAVRDAKRRTPKREAA